MGQLSEALEKLGARRKVLCLPPDISRLHSGAGELTRELWRYYGDRLSCVMPAIGTHAPMTDAEIGIMFGDMPRRLFRVHDWRGGLARLGEVPPEFVRQLSEGRLDFAWPAEVNRLLVEGGFDLIISIGQVVPHEVAGMANHNKNIFVGAGGAEGIGKSHYLGAVYGLERIMGRADTPVRRLFDYASENFARHLPILYVLTVMGRNEEGKLVRQGLFIGQDRECFRQAAALSLKHNLTLLDRDISKAVVYLDPQEYKSTWIGNKAIYRTRMALAEGAELVIIGPGVKTFGEDPEIDRLIRKYGYRGTEATVEAVRRNADLAANLSAAAHLIHGSSEGCFTIAWCPGGLSRQEVEGVGYRWGEPASMLKRYDPARLEEGFNLIDGEEIYFISNPALGLWAQRRHFPDAG